MDTTYNPADYNLTGDMSSLLPGRHDHEPVADRLRRLELHVAALWSLATDDVRMANIYAEELAYRIKQSAEDAAIAATFD